MIWRWALEEAWTNLFSRDLFLTHYVLKPGGLGGLGGIPPVSTLLRTMVGIPPRERFLNRIFLFVQIGGSCRRKGPRGHQ